LTVNDIVTTVATEVTEIYNPTNIPTIPFDSIIKEVKRLIEKGNITSITIYILVLIAIILTTYYSIHLIFSNNILTKPK